MVQTAQGDARIPGPGPAGAQKTRRLVVAGVLSLATLIGAGTPQGAVVVVEVQNLLDFYAGVISLITLTGAVTFGLMATERITSVRMRILTQAVHRSAAVVAVGFLVVHVVLKILGGRAAMVDAFLPFVAPSDRVLWVGLGTIGAHLMLLTFGVGILRRRFVPSSRKWIWRLMHCSAYIAWPVALVHGLTAGRFPAVWVQWSWAVCVLVVGIGALTRMMTSLRFGNSTTAAARPGVARRLRAGPTGRTDKYSRARTEQARVERGRAGPPPQRMRPPPQEMPVRGGRPAGRGRPVARGGRPPGPGRPGPGNGVPDEEFWSKLRNEVGPLSGERR